ncbi:MAG TPA: hypothetical protein VNL37_07645, partial [Candidatus Polarisedimenticolia bacterium]|nr:hypothetical protein [Candidatus Polarisedimenticolia bacterium]
MSKVEARLLSSSERDEALAYLLEDARANLLLIDLVARLGKPPAPGEMRSQVALAAAGGEIRGIAALHPTVVLDTRM